MPADLREVNKEEDWRLSLLILAQTAKQHVLFHENLAPFDSSLKKKKLKKKNRWLIWPGYSPRNPAEFLVESKPSQRHLFAELLLQRQNYFQKRKRRNDFSAEGVSLFFQPFSSLIDKQSNCFLLQAANITFLFKANNIPFCWWLKLRGEGEYCVIFFLKYTICDI